VRKEDETHSEGDPVVGGEDDGLNGDIAYPDVAEDDGIVKGDFAGHWGRNERRTRDGRNDVLCMATRETTRFWTAELIMVCVESQQPATEKLALALFGRVWQRRPRVWPCVAGALM
jgi:hypothetical protein